MTETEIVTQAINGGPIVIGILFGSAILKILKRWLVVLEMQENVMIEIMKHLTKKENQNFLGDAVESIKSIRTDVRKIRQSALPVKDRSLIQTGDDIHKP